MVLNTCGAIIIEEWERSAEMRWTLGRAAVVVMPNHLHGLVACTRQSCGDRASGTDAHGGSALDSALLPDHRSLHRAPWSLGPFLAEFKATSTKRVNALRGTPGVPVFQRNYDERIVRTEDAYARTSNDIMTNPVRWEIDREKSAQYGDDEFDAWLGLNERERLPLPQHS